MLFKMFVLNLVINEFYFSMIGDLVLMVDVVFVVVIQDVNNCEIDMDWYIVVVCWFDFNWQQVCMVIVQQLDFLLIGQVIYVKVFLLDFGFVYEFWVQVICLLGYFLGFFNMIIQIMGYLMVVFDQLLVLILFSKLSMVKVEWNGLDFFGVFYLVQFCEVQVEVLINNFIWFYVGDIFFGGVLFIMSGKGGVFIWNVGDIVYVCFKVMNSVLVILGIFSVSLIVVLGVVGLDIVVNIIMVNNIVVGILMVEQIKVYSFLVESLVVGNLFNLVVDLIFVLVILNIVCLIQVNVLLVSGVVWIIMGVGVI